MLVAGDDVSKVRVHEEQPTSNKLLLNANKNANINAKSKGVKAFDLSWSNAFDQELQFFHKIDYKMRMQRRNEKATKEKECEHGKTML